MHKNYVLFVSCVPEESGESTGLVVNDTPASSTMEGVEEVSWLAGRKVRVPVPTERIVEHMYSINWRHPFTKWRWDLDPFLTGYCKY